MVTNIRSPNKNPGECAPPAPGTDLEDAAGKPISVASPEKKRGFHEYERKALPYRDHKDRILDWEETGFCLKDVI